jgi:Endonuclease/Exonuclease/phosphatase family
MVGCRDSGRREALGGSRWAIARHGVPVDDDNGTESTPCRPPRHPREELPLTAAVPQRSCTAKTVSTGLRFGRATSRRSVRALAALATFACLGYVAAVPASATAAPRLAKPSGVHVAAVSGTSLTVAAHRLTNAHRYRLFASTTKSDVFVVNLTSKRASRHVASAAKPRVRISGLKFTTAPYYYRLVAVAGSRIRYSGIGSVRLRPSTPRNLQITNDSTGTYLTWSSGTATGFAIAQGSDRDLRKDRRDYTIRGQGSTQFTPPGLTKGTTYYFRVRAKNGSTVSAYSATEVSATVATSQQPVTVMTYNVLTSLADGTVQGGQTVASWNTQREPGVVSFIRQANPDVISIQEGGGWVTPVQGFGGSRQVDSLAAALGPDYSLADTEIPPSQHGYTRTGNYILFRTSAYRPVGAGGHWFLDSSTTAAYQMLQNTATGATFLFVAPHPIVGRGAAFDLARENETRTLVQLARAQAGGQRIIYAGDFNSYLSHTHLYDGPGRAMRAAGVADGLLAAQSRANQNFNSANQYLRTPPQDSVSIDHIFAEPGVSFNTWSELLNLSQGQLVGVIPSDHNPVVSAVTIPY